ncbi:MAG: pyridoxamine 5'-phosphate oxidase family protein [Chitinophagaceae bacterium]|nr:pyridoxamine 5'-phosphate oxidase family protein [Chitinophagaceae bacterium]
MEKKFHAGELKIQQLLGEEAIADSNGKLISNTIAKGAINFIEKQSLVVISSTDPRGNIWSSLLLGESGFATIVDPGLISFDTSKIYTNPEDVFFNNIKVNSGIGSLFIELTTRKRYRINGISYQAGSSIHVKVNEAYPNCPKYIQQRAVSQSMYFNSPKIYTEKGNELSDLELSWIACADTFFVSSSSLSGNLDASHRGGKSGFIEILNDHTLKIPDYQGNSLYNTLGNIASNPNVGLLFIDFENGHTLQLTGKAETVFSKKLETDIDNSFNTGRYWLFKTKQWIRTEYHPQVALAF